MARVLVGVSAVYGTEELKLLLKAAGADPGWVSPELQGREPRSFGALSLTWEDVAGHSVPVFRFDDRLLGHLSDFETG